MPRNYKARSTAAQTGAPVSSRFAVDAEIELPLTAGTEIEDPTPEAPEKSEAQNLARWAVRQAIVRMELSWGARECWRLLESFPTGNCYPSHCWLGETLRKSPSAIRRYLKELKCGGYIDVVPRFDHEVKFSAGTRVRRTKSSRGQLSNRYKVLEQPDLMAYATHILQELQAKQSRQKQ